MVVSLWSLKGGSGCSVMAALLGLHEAEANPDGALLVDLRGDLPLVLGCPAPGGSGLGEWLEAGTQSPPDGLGRVATEIAPGLKLIGPGNTPFPAQDPPDLMLRQLDAFPGSVIVDAGLVLEDCRRSALARWFGTLSTRSILVTQACYLALSRVAALPITPSGVIVVSQDGRALGAPDVEAATKAPVVAQIAYDMAIARAVDAGLLLGRFPRGVRRAMRDVA